VRLVEKYISEGSGLYTLREAAHYARMQPITVARWFKGDNYCKQVFSLGDEKIITFLDFIQALAVRNLRVHYHVPLKDIREAVSKAQNHLHISHPFAHEHTTFLFEGKIWIQLPERSLMQIAGRGRGQTGMLPVIESFYKDISFDSRTRYANRYKAFERTYASGTYKITMDPELRFGEPLLDNSGYTPQAIVEAAKTEGSIEEAARCYGITEDQARACFDYWDYLSNNAN
jgi:uncharacterized protein (DUF433 family)